MFRFTIRELLLLTAIVALVLVWWVGKRRLEIDRRRLERDLVHQVDLVIAFSHALTELGCEIPQDTGPYTKVLVPERLQAYARDKGQSATVSVTTSVPRTELQRTLDGGFNRFRAAPPATP